jgi:hypothetical protein
VKTIDFRMVFVRRRRVIKHRCLLCGTKMDKRAVVSLKMKKLCCTSCIVSYKILSAPKTAEELVQEQGISIVHSNMCMRFKVSQRNTLANHDVPAMTLLS